ncbi:MAG TPA: hypothetical protein VJM08_06830 [Anaerolineales bacterium]|nr:hypothetical protein [Anaerolineales bacterium]
MAGTTPGYVAKVVFNYNRSIKKLRPPKVNDNSGAPNKSDDQTASKAQSVENVESQLGSDMRNLGFNSRKLEANLLSNEDRAKLWKEFPNRTIPEIIATYGFPPEVVFLEYQWYEKLKGTNLHDIQRALVAKVGESLDVLSRWSLKEELDDYQRILAAYNRDLFLSGSQLKNLLDIHEKITYRRGKEFVKDLSEAPPTGWVRPKFNCGHLIPGVVADPLGWGREAIAAVSNKSHMACASPPNF